MLKGPIATAAAILASLLAGGTALAASPEVSTNWSGYVAAGAGGAPATFGDVTGTWVQPKATCSAGRIDAAAFWVGLGGNSADSASLEQLGTSVSCDGTSTTPTYEAWWEIVPAGSVPIPLKIHPGDRVNAAVLVNRQTVTMSLKNLTRHTRFSHDDPRPAARRRIRGVDRRGALDVLAERPLQPVPADALRQHHFHERRRDRNAHPGTISDPTWASSVLELISPDPGRFVGAGDPFGAGVGAVPGGLSTDGRSFSVTWKTNLAR